MYIVEILGVIKNNFIFKFSFYLRVCFSSLYICFYHGIDDLNTIIILKPVFVLFIIYYIIFLNNTHHNKRNWDNYK